MTQITKEAIEAAEREFTEYFVRNYPGPDTIIFDPKWHAPKLFRAATRSLISSPGKDGGPEVDGKRVERWRRASIALGSWMAAALDDDEVCEAMKADIREWFSASEPFEGMALPQPASTALVEALKHAEAVLAIYADSTGYTDSYGNQLDADAGQHEGLLAQSALEVVRSALSSSTSRKGER